jgi:hypothetical protein
MSRKFRSAGSTSEQALSRSKKYKYNSAGTLVELTGTAGDTDIVFSGSKSNLRRIADLERNISILANKVLTTDGNAEDSDDADFENKFTDDVRFKAETRFDDVMTVKSTLDASSGTVKLSTWQVGGVAVSASAAELNILDGVTASTTELNYMDGVTSNVQTQMNTKAPTANPTFTGTVNAAAVTTTGNVTVGGNLTVSGTTTTVNSNTVNIGDSVITLNSDETGAPSQNGGFEIERGTSSNVSFVWDEANDMWTTAGQTMKVGHLLPQADVTYDLGSSSLKWRDLYLSGSTINLGTATLSASGTSVSLGGGGSFDLSNSSTSDLSEGTNQYYTTARANAAIDARVTTSFVNALNVNATTLDGIDSTAFVRSNANDSVSGVISFTNTTNSGSATTGAIVVSGGIGCGGNIYASGDVTAYSDAALKTNVATIDGGLDKVMALRGITFERIADGSVSTGVIAQDVAAVLPEAVATDENGVMAVKYGNLVGLLIEAIKDLKEEVNELKGNGTVH